MPLLKGHQQMYHRAFTTLSRFRRAGGQGGVERIAYPDILAYADETGINGEDQRDRLVYLIAEMDDTYMQHMAKATDRNPDWVRPQDTETKLKR
jgi:hypothetical protein